MSVAIPVFKAVSQIQLTPGSTINIPDISWEEFEAILPSSDFFRIHRSALINISFVKEYSNHEGGEVILIDGTRVQVSKARIQEFSEFIKTKSVSPK